MTRRKKTGLLIVWILVALPLANYFTEEAYWDNWSATIAYPRDLNTETSVMMRNILVEVQRERFRTRNVNLILSTLLITLPLTYPLAAYWWRRQRSWMRARRERSLPKDINRNVKDESIGQLENTEHNNGNALINRHNLIIFAMVIFAASTINWYVWAYVPKDGALQTVANALSDPESAKFRNVRQLDNGAWCGEVNAKNKLGGYTGYTSFVYDDPADKNKVKVKIAVAEPNTYVDRIDNEQIVRFCR